MDASEEREEIARSNGFDSYADLLNFSRLLPQWSTDEVKTYIAQRASGRRFFWEERTRPPEAED